MVETPTTPPPTTPKVAGRENQQASTPSDSLPRTRRSFAAQGITPVVKKFWGGGTQISYVTVASSPQPNPPSNPPQQPAPRPRGRTKGSSKAGSSSVTSRTNRPSIQPSTPTTESATPATSTSTASSDQISNNSKDSTKSPETSHEISTGGESETVDRSTAPRRSPLKRPRTTDRSSSSQNTPSSPRHDTSTPESAPQSPRKSSPPATPSGSQPRSPRMNLEISPSESYTLQQQQTGHDLPKKRVLPRRSQKRGLVPGQSRPTGGPTSNGQDSNSNISTGMASIPIANAFTPVRAPETAKTNTWSAQEQRMRADIDRQANEAATPDNETTESPQTDSYAPSFDGAYDGQPELAELLRDDDPSQTTAALGPAESTEDLKPDDTIESKVDATTPHAPEETRRMTLSEALKLMTRESLEILVRHSVVDAEALTADDVAAELEATGVCM
ncbi:hypothetical protein DFS34DRAFT_599440 [Phlyctochytrium arcticum]|nr:hypothetical protein DFS34DRAFT_599440 [Phlyctochytrium arcticum]